MAQLLIIDRQLLRLQQRPWQERLESLIPYSRGQWRLLILSWQPEQWQPTRRSVDENLLFQQQTHEQLLRLGADLDGFVYLPSPVFGRRRLRAKVLSGVIQRYAIAASAAWLISGRVQNIEVGIMTGLNTLQLCDAAHGGTASAGAVPVADWDAALARLASAAST